MQKRKRARYPTCLQLLTWHSLNSLRHQQFPVHCFKQDPNFLCTPAKSFITAEDNSTLPGEEPDRNFPIITSDFDSALGESWRCAATLDDNTTLSRFGDVDVPHDQGNDDIFQQDVSPTLNFTFMNAPSATFTGLNAAENCSSNPLLPPYIKSLPSQVAAEDINYLNQIGAFAIPDTELRNALLQGFAEYVYPYMPVLDLKSFMDIIGQGDGSIG